MMVEDIIYAADRIAGILRGPGQTFSGDDANDGLKCLNSMLDAWKIQRLTIYAILRSLFTLTPNKQDYTIGNDPTADTADFVVERPTKIEGLSWISGETEVPMRVFTDQTWKLYSAKETTGTEATGYWYQPLHPNGKLWFTPIPTTASQIALYSTRSIDQFQQTTDPVVLPPGYQRAIELNLAVELAMRTPDNTITQLTVSEARKALGWLKANNQPDLRMSCENATLGSAGRRTGGRYDLFSNRIL